MFAQPSPTQPSHTRLNGMVRSPSPAVPHEPSAAPHEPGEVQRHAPTAVPRNSTGSLHADTQVSRLRDLLLADVPAGRLVIACDAVGGIGSRPGDSYPADPTWCAHLAARVPLLEVLCGGAQPMVLVNTLCQDAASAQPMIEEFQRCAVATGDRPPGRHRIDGGQRHHHPDRDRGDDHRGTTGQSPWHTGSRRGPDSNGTGAGSRRARMRRFPDLGAG